MTSASAKRSEFLFCYDTRMANPNGDPDENRPRIDPINGKNLVTEFRLKRTIRDYLKKRGEPIFIREDLKADGSRKTIEELADAYLKKKKDKKGSVKVEAVDKTKLIKEHIDVRLFGLLFAVSGVQFKQVGPVQFSIGCSLNKVTELPIRMTRVVPTAEEKRAGTFGEKSVLRYSFIVFHGLLNEIAGKEVDLTEEDVDKMMRGMWFGTNDLNTASKFGQVSRFLFRVMYSKPNAYIGDLDRGISLEKNGTDTDLDKLENISQTVLNVNELLKMLLGNKQNIESIHFACHDAVMSNNGKVESLASQIETWAQNNKIPVRNLLTDWSSSK